MVSWTIKGGTRSKDQEWYAKIVLLKDANVITRLASESFRWIENRIAKCIL